MHYSSEKTRDRLVAATIESIYQHGYSDTTVTKISDIANTAVGMINHHFDSKESLLAETMRRLLFQMHGRVLQRTAAAASPRGKLWAVIESVLSDDHADNKMTAVWFTFWLQAEYDERLQRLRDTYNRRVQSNLRSYLRQLLLEIGAQNVDARVQSGALMILSMMHGVWVSYTLREDLSRDLEHGRLLVWECIEMLLSRAREPLRDEQVTVATSGAMLANISVEIIANDMKTLPQWQPYGNKNMPVFLPHFRGSSGGGGDDDRREMKQKAEITQNLRAAGFLPVPHIAARNVASAGGLHAIVAGLTQAGADEFLLLGGGDNPPAGEFHSALQLLQSGVLEAHNVRRVGFAGHPEKHPDQPRDAMRRALIEKIAVAKAMGIECYIVTQFCFATRPFFDFLDWVHEQQFNVPVRLGVAGRVNTARLVKFSAACGIGRSLSFLKRQFKKTMGLVNYSPEGLLAELAARNAVHRYPFPVHVHFYPFGAVTDTLALASDAVMGSDSAAASS